MVAATVVVMYWTGKVFGDGKTGLLDDGFSAVIGGRIVICSMYCSIDHRSTENQRKRGNKLPAGLWIAGIHRKSSPREHGVGQVQEIPFFMSFQHSLMMEFDPCQVYSPEADTLLLLEAARAEVRPGDRVLEVGAGSGLIAAEIAKITCVVATDINPHAVSCTRQKGIEVVRTDLMSGFRGLFDLIIFNPPYLPTRPEERINDWLEYALDGGENGRSVIGRFASAAGDVLSPGGRILILISALTGIHAVEKLFATTGFTTEIVLQREAEDEVLFVLRITRNTAGINSASGTRQR